VRDTHTKARDMSRQRACHAHALSRRTRDDPEIIREDPLIEKAGGSGIRFKTAIPLGSQSPARPAHPSPVRGPVREPVPNSGSGIRFKAAILSPLGSQGPKAAKSATREDSSAAQVRERSAAPPSPPPPALHRHRLPSRRPDGGSTFRTMGSGRDRADSGPATSCKSEHLYEKF